MANSITIENYGASTLAASLFTSVIASEGSRTLTDARTVDVDIYLDDYDRAAALGAYITVDGTLRAGALSNVTGETLADDIRVVKSDTTAGIHTLELMPIANVPVGTTLFINFAVDGGDLTIDGNGAEEIDGSTTLVLTDVGYTRLQATAAGEWTEL